jgi:hypothetical protein
MNGRPIELDATARAVLRSSVKYTREDVRRVPCPRCGVGSGAFCVRYIGGPTRVSPHQVRVDQYLIGGSRYFKYAERLDQLRRMPYAQYLTTPEWKRQRSSALRRARYMCQVCSAKIDLRVHHRTYERRGCEAPEDLIVLCRQCHATFHGKADSR